jgi:hypothetical protein
MPQKIPCFTETLFLPIAQKWQDLLSTAMCDLRNYWNDSIKCGVDSLEMII